MEDNKKFDEILEEYYQKYEFVTLIVLTIILLLSWLLSSDITTKILGNGIITQRLKIHVHGSVIITIIMTAVIMRIVGWKVITYIIGIISKKERMERDE